MSRSSSYSQSCALFLLVSVVHCLVVMSSFLNVHVVRTSALLEPAKHPLLFSLQLQRLKRSLSFKYVMRSKSMDNFFQRNNAEFRVPSTIITTTPPTPIPESPLSYERSPSLSPSVSPNPSMTSQSPSISPSLSSTSQNQPKPQAQPVKTHFFQEHVFRRPTCCQRCKHMIQGKSLFIYLPISHCKWPREKLQPLNRIKFWVYPHPSI